MVKRHLSCSYIICVFLVISGIMIFLTPVIVPLLDDSGILPVSYEWPVGNASGIITTPDGLNIVPVETVGRVQVYDADWHFTRGWSIHANGDSYLTLLKEPTNAIEVISVRSHWKSIFDIEGHLLSKEPDDPFTFYSVYTPARAKSKTVWVPTPFWLWPLTSPFIGWGIGVIGALGLKVLRKNQQKKI